MHRYSLLTVLLAKVVMTDISLSRMGKFRSEFGQDQPSVARVKILPMINGTDWS